MHKFKVGDVVTLVSHYADSADNVDIGAVGRVADVREDGSGFYKNGAVFVFWDSYSFDMGWWVDASCIRGKAANLENK